MKFSGIYAITDDNLLSDSTIVTAVDAALSAGINLLQYRSKSGSAEVRLATARQLNALALKHGVPLLINDDVDLCLAVAAAGVHLGRQDETLQSARSRLGPNAIIGVTCHASLDAALAAEQLGADYVAFGRFFPSQTKPEAPAAPMALLAEARSQLSTPIVAIGGINAENGAAILQAGADMLAIIHGIFGSEDVGSSTRQLVNICQTHTAQRQSQD